MIVMDCRGINVRISLGRTCHDNGQNEDTRRRGMNEYGPQRSWVVIPRWGAKKVRHAPSIWVPHE